MRQDWFVNILQRLSLSVGSAVVYIDAVDSTAQENSGVVMVCVTYMLMHSRTLETCVYRSDAGKSNGHRVGQVIKYVIAHFD